MKVYLALLCIGIIAVSCDVDVEKHLKQFGYYNPLAFDGTSLTDSIKIYQKTFGLPETGVADEATKKLMSTPRCGLSDHHNKGYADQQWSKKALTYYYNNYTPDLSQSQTRALTEQAFKFWSDVTPLTFRETQGRGDIVLHFGYNSHHDGRERCSSRFDGKGGVLAHAYFPPDGRLHFDEAEQYTTKSRSGTNYLWVATHELGHILGLEHDNGNRDAVMYPYYRSYNPNGMRLHVNDIRRIQRQYGRGTGGGSPQTQPPLTQPPRTLAPPGDCKDIVTNCYRYLNKCDNYSSSWTRYMAKYCKKSCSKCGIGGTCFDKSPNCSVNLSKCRASGWVDFMKGKCKKSCNYC